MSMLCSVSMNADTPNEGGDDSDSEEGVLTRKDDGTNNNNKRSSLYPNYIYFYYTGDGIQLSMIDMTEVYLYIQGFNNEEFYYSLLSNTNNYFLYTGSLKGTYRIICELPENTIYSGKLVVE